LEMTLESLKQLSLPINTLNELLVIDNGSTDNTAEIVKNCFIPNIETRYFFEPKRGLSYARNRGLREAKGEVIIFIDDDVRPSREWLINILTYFNVGKVNAIAGKVILPNERLRPWMKKIHRKWLASTEGIKPNEFVGANMAFVRSVLDQVPEFDVELGAGALGFGEEALFSRQLIEAGYQIAYADNVVVTHFFNEQRLSRPEWLINAAKRGFTRAYIAYHWDHKKIKNLLYLYLRYKFTLNYWRINHLGFYRSIDGCAEEELQLVRTVSFYKRFMIEKRRSRNYAYHGLVKNRLMCDC
jgi:glucosyl-dolichyl phosphate glucuronosyltransferase